MEQKNMIKNQKGFTLIEIIAVLVILGVLAAVAAPKYFDLAASADQASADMALGEGVAALSQAYGDYILNTGSGTAPTAAQLVTAVGSPWTSGDFTITYSAGAAAGDMDIVITGGPANVMALAAANRTKTVNYTLSP